MLWTNPDEYGGAVSEMRLLSNLQRWLEVHTHPNQETPSKTLWKSTSPGVREMALNRTYERLSEHEREVRETLDRLEAEVQSLTEYRVRPATQAPTQAPTQEHTGDEGGSSAAG